jgi:hypothetical protein
LKKVNDSCHRPFILQSRRSNARDFSHEIQTADGILDIYQSGIFSDDRAFGGREISRASDGTVVTPSGKLTPQYISLSFKKKYSTWHKPVCVVVMAR